MKRQHPVPLAQQRERTASTVCYCSSKHPYREELPKSWGTSGYLWVGFDYGQTTLVVGWTSLQDHVEIWYMRCYSDFRPWLDKPSAYKKATPVFVQSVLLAGTQFLLTTLSKVRAGSDEAGFSY